jgi:glycosyltransferase involved in cell wall biosynthesis
VRVGINARLLASPDLRGFNRYTAELVRALAATGGVDVVLFSDAPIHRRHALDGIPTVIGAVRPQFRWQHGWLPGALKAERIELFHAPAHWGVPWRSACPVVVTIHDVADRELPAPPPQAFAASARHELEQWLAVRRARRIIAVSEWTARSVSRHLGVAPERIAVTVEGAAPAFDAPPPPAHIVAVRAASGLSGPYFVYAGGFDPRKNLGALVAALASLPEERRFTIALVGAGADGEDAARLRRDAARRGVLRWLRFTGAVDDATLAALYAGAVAVVLPSWLEGFGLPVVEAMHLGIPAAVSTAGSLPEITGDAGLVFPPDDPGMLADALLRLAGDDALREALAAKARARAPLFTWRRAAEQTLEVYRRAAGA